MQDAEGGRALFVDGGVYTRNRAFRLFLSSKAGKDAVLRPTGKLLILCPAIIAMSAHDMLKNAELHSDVRLVSTLGL